MLLDQERGFEVHNRRKILSPKELPGNFEGELSGAEHLGVAKGYAREIPLAAVDRDRGALRLEWRARNDMDDPARRVRSVQCRRWAEHHLDAVDVDAARCDERRHVDAKRRNEREAVVDQEHEVAAEQAVESTRNDIRLNHTTRSDIQSRHRAKVIDDGRRRSVGDGLLRDREDRRRRVDHFLGRA